MSQGGDDRKQDLSLSDEQGMRLALAQAQLAAAAGEVPVGAVVVNQNPKTPRHISCVDINNRDGTGVRV